MTDRSPPRADDLPHLELVFATDDQTRFLIDASFRKNAFAVAAHTLRNVPPRGEILRALCILMLLAKYMGEGCADEDGNIAFVADDDESTWIKQLGNGFGQQARLDFCRFYFRGCEFLSASRGSEHNARLRNREGEGRPPSAKYHHGTLPLGNLTFFKASRKSPNASRLPMTQEELAFFAEKLERQAARRTEEGTATKDGWKCIVPDIIAGVKRDRPFKSEAAAGPGIHRRDDSAPFILSARWRKLLHEVHKDIEGNVRPGDWHVICLTPNWLTDWKGVFLDAVAKHHARVRIAYHSPLAAKKCISVRAQWLMHVSAAFDGGSIEDVRKRLEGLKGELKTWPAEARRLSVEKEAQKGGFEFFESYISHHFLGILFVPHGAGKLRPHAPEGAWCMLEFYPLYSSNLEHRCGLFLNRPSPMLDIYYHSILEFFERGVGDRYLDPDPFRLTRKGR